MHGLVKKFLMTTHIWKRLSIDVNSLKIGLINVFEFRPVTPRELTKPKNRTILCLDVCIGPVAKEPFRKDW